MNASVVLPLLLLLAVAATPSSTAEIADAGVYIEGDVIIGGLFPVSRDNCRIIDSQQGIQRMEAMIFSLEQANSDQQLLRYGRHKIRLGGLLFDTCSSREMLLARVIEFLKSSNSACQAPDGSLLTPPMWTFGGSVSLVAGVVGASSSEDTMLANGILRYFSVPMISYASSAGYLRDRNRFEWFARTVPSYTDEAAALADLAAHFNWTYVSLVFSEFYFQMENAAAFENTAGTLGLCIAARLIVKHNAGQREINEIMQRMRDYSRARVVVLFTTEDHTRMLLDAARRADVPPGRFIWLSGELGTTAALGSFVLKTATREMPNFTKYFTSLRPEVQRRTSLTGGVGFRNKYFDQFWQQNFNCSLGKGNRTTEPFDLVRPACSSGGFAIQPDRFKQNERIQNVYDAVLTYAYGLDKVMQRVCVSQGPDSDTKANGTFEQCVRNISKFHGGQLYDILIDKNNSFINNAGNKVEYTKNGDRVAEYLIYNYQQDASTRQYVPRVVGKWTTGVGLSLSGEASVVWPGGRVEPPISTCSDECASGQRKVAAVRSSCCWMCFD